MNLAKVLSVAMHLGARATELELLLEAYSDNLSDKKKQWYTETLDMLRAGEAAINVLLKERDNLCAFTHNEMKNAEYNRNLVKSIIEEKTLL